MELDDKGSDRPLTKLKRGIEVDFRVELRTSSRFDGAVVSLTDKECANPVVSPGFSLEREADLKENENDRWISFYRDRSIYFCNVHVSVSDVLRRFFSGYCPSSPVECERPRKAKVEIQSLAMTRQKEGTRRRSNGEKIYLD